MTPAARVPGSKFRSRAFASTAAIRTDPPTPFQEIAMKLLRALLAAIALACPASASAQAILQGGPWAPGHAPMYVGQGSTQPIVQDSGPAGGGTKGLGL